MRQGVFFRARAFEKREKVVYITERANGVSSSKILEFLHGTTKERVYYPYARRQRAQ